MDVKRGRTGDGKVGLAVLDVGLFEDLGEDRTEITVPMQSKKLGDICSAVWVSSRRRGCNGVLVYDPEVLGGIGAGGQSESTAILLRRGREEGAESRYSPLRAAHYRRAERGGLRGYESRC